MYIRARVAAELENDHDMTRVEKIDVAELKNFEKREKMTYASTNSFLVKSGCFKHKTYANMIFWVFTSIFPTLP